jgi:hypothetical protein
MKKKPESDQDIHLRLMIGDNHISCVFPDIFATFDANPPGRHHPGINRSPEASEQMQKPQTPVKGIRNDAKKQGH